MFLDAAMRTKERIKKKKKIDIINISSQKISM